MTVTAAASAPRSLRRRFDSSIFRWQARFETDLADNVIPWVAAVVLAVIYFVLADARYRGSGGGVDLAGYLQARWLILHGHAPTITVTGRHLLSDHFPIAFYPLAWLTRIIPAVPTLLGIQAVSLAFGIVPLWRMARRIASLRTGAAAALLVAYACSPAINNVNLADFHPAAVAVAPLLGATYLALRERWHAFALVALLVVVWEAELALVIAGLGVLVFMRGRRGIGRRIVIGSLAWLVIAVLILEPHFGNAGLIAPGAFHAYGHSTAGVIGGMIAHPFRVLGDVFAQDNVHLLVVLLAPLLFLPVLAPRYLIPALPLQALFFVADVPKQGNEVALPLTVFAFVAATFALTRMGRMGIERVTVDRRVLIALSVAAIAFFATEAVDSPYQRPWQWGRQDAADHARHDAAHTVTPGLSVRASPSVLTLVAERRHAYALSGRPDAGAATADDVDRVIVDTNATAWSSNDWLGFSSDMVRRGYRVQFNGPGVVVFSKTAAS